MIASRPRRTRWLSAVSITAVALSSLAACSREPESAAPVAAPSLVEVAGDPSAVVATFAGGDITRGDIRDALTRRLARLPAPVTEAARTEVVRTVLERQARIGMLYREGAARGLAERADVILRTRVTEERILADDWLERHAAQGARATDEQVQAEVARRMAAASPEVRRFSQIFLRAAQSDAAARQAARAKMETIRQELAAGRSFDELARQHSDSVTARAGGRVEWTPRAPLHHKLGDAIFSLAEGQVGEPVETEVGLHLFRVDGIRRAQAPDPTELTARVRQELDSEAVKAAVQQARTQALDAAGARVDNRALALPLTAASADRPVATAGSVAIRRDEFDILRRAWATHRALPDADFARLILGNRILADRARAEGPGPELEARLAQARKLEVVAVRREELIAEIPLDVKAEEEAAFYAENAGTSPLLREVVLDLLFYPQSGDSPAGVYAEGEQVSRRLRDGEAFQAILASEGRRAGVLVRERIGGSSLDSMGRESNRLADALRLLAVGDVSPPIYMDGERITFGQPRPVLEGKGVVFVRLVEVRPFALDAVRPLIREHLARLKEGEGINQIQRRLDAESNLRILLPLG